MKTILILSSESFPIGNAYASRINAFIKMFLQMQCKVILLCDEIKNDKDYGEHNVELLPIVTKRMSRLSRIFYIPKEYSKAVKRIMSTQKIDLVISRSMPDRFLKVFSQIKKTNVPFILESCERYHFSNWSFGFLNPRYWQFLFAWFFLYPKVDGVIAISTYLQHYYLKKKLPAIVIPAISDISKFSLSYHGNNKQKIKLVFFGSLGGGKDHIKEIIQVLSSSERFSQTFEFHLFGPTEKEISRFLRRKHKFLSTLFFHARIKPQDFQNVLQQFDFGVLLRPNRRSTLAGFPTKLVDYLSMGLPVISNPLGDTDLYLKEDINCIKLVSLSKNEIERALNKIIGLPKEKMDQMRYNSRKTAEQYFHYSQYVERTTVFFKKIFEEQ